MWVCVGLRGFAVCSALMAKFSTGTAGRVRRTAGMAIGCAFGCATGCAIGGATIARSSCEANPEDPRRCTGLSVPAKTFHQMALHSALRGGFLRWLSSPHEAWAGSLLDSVAAP